MNILQEDGSSLYNGNRGNSLFTKRSVIHRHQLVDRYAEPHGSNTMTNGALEASDCKIYPSKHFAKNNEDDAFTHLEFGRDNNEDAEDSDSTETDGGFESELRFETKNEKLKKTWTKLKNRNSFLTENPKVVTILNHKVFDFSEPNEFDDRTEYNEDENSLSFFIDSNALTPPSAAKKESHFEKDSCNLFKTIYKERRQHANACESENKAEDKMTALEEKIKTLDFHYTETEKSMMESIDCLKDRLQGLESVRNALIRERKLTSRRMSKALEILKAQNRDTSGMNLNSKSTVIWQLAGKQKMRIVQQLLDEEKVSFPRFEPIAVKGGTLYFVKDEELQKPTLSTSSGSTTITPSDSDSNYSSYRCHENEIGTYARSVKKQTENQNRPMEVSRRGVSVPKRRGTASTVSGDSILSISSQNTSIESYVAYIPINSSPSSKHPNCPSPQPSLIDNTIFRTLSNCGESQKKMLFTTFLHGAKKIAQRLSLADRTPSSQGHHRKQITYPPAKKKSKSTKTTQK